MKQIIFGFILLLQSQIFASDEKKIMVAYFGKVTDQEFIEKIKPVFSENSQCKTCEIVNWTPYDGNLKYDESKLVDKVAQLDAASLRNN